MQKTSIKLNKINLMGIKIRTSYELENSPNTSKIHPCVINYFHNKIFDNIPNRKNPGKTYCLYAEYDSDYKGAYSYFIGEEVLSFENELQGLEKITIPEQNYVKFTTPTGPMPHVVKNAWQEIWDMPSEKLGKRNYCSDFEVYDERALDPSQVVLDLFIGIKSK